MGRIIIMMVLSALVSKGLWMLYTGITKQEEKKAEVEFTVTAEHGAVGCLSKAKFKEEEKYYNSGDYKSAQRLLDDQECFYFDKGYKLFAQEGTCSKQNKNDELFPFKPNDFMMLQPYLPCAAVR